MRLVKCWREWFFVPFLIFGYMETLRWATFFSFGAASQGSAFTVATILVITWVALNFFSRRLWLKIFCGIVTAAYFLLVLANNYTGKGTLLSTGFPWSLPVLSGSQTEGNADVIVLLVFLFYGLLLFLLTNYVLARKSIDELTPASTLLLGVEIASSNLDLSKVAVLHVIFVLLLRSNIFYLYLLSQPEFQETKREFGSGWVRVNLAITVIIATAALLIPTGGAGLAVTSRPVQWAKAQVLEKAWALKKPQQYKTGRTETDSFHLYWDKLQGFKINGTVEASDKLVMSVNSPQPFYWRGETADFYTGVGWENSFKADRIHKSNTELPNPYPESIPVQRVELTFTLSPDLSSTVVFTANDPAAIDLTGRVFWSDEAGNYYTDEMKSGFTYKVAAYIPEVNEKQLRKAKSGSSAWIEKYYLQLPENFPGRVKEKAREITKGLVYPYDKAKAIERYLATNYPYTLQVEHSEKDQDIVESFLFDFKKGYCTYHSTAMVVMLRSIGIPARWVKGFATGHYDAKTGTYLVQEGDAHAWVEVYFEDFGWVPFEPTASFQMPAVQMEPVIVTETGAAKAEDTNVKNTNRDSGREVELTPSGFVPHVLYSGIMLLTFLTVISLWRSVRKKIKEYDSGRVRDFYLEMVSLLENKGVYRNGSQTPYEFAWSVCERFPGIREDVVFLTEGYLKEQYGNHKYNEAQFDRFRKARENIAAMLREER